MLAFNGDSVVAGLHGDFEWPKVMNVDASLIAVFACRRSEVSQVQSIAIVVSEWTSPIRRQAATIAIRIVEIIVEIFPVCQCHVATLKLHNASEPFHLPILSEARLFCELDFISRASRTHLRIFQTIIFTTKSRIFVVESTKN